MEPTVVIEMKDNRIMIQQPMCNLEMLLNQITAENRHHTMLENQDKGNEEW